MNVILHISTAQGPAECQMFARFAMQHITKEAAEKNIQLEVQTASESKHGILSALIRLEGNHAEECAGRWLGTLQWICPSPLRKKHPRKNWYIGVFRLPDMQPLADNGEIVLQTCRAGGKGGQHVNKTESAVRATHIASGISVRVESERSQHANKKQALALLAQNSPKPNKSSKTHTHKHNTPNFIRLNAATLCGCLKAWHLKKGNVAQIKRPSEMFQTASLFVKPHQTPRRHLAKCGRRFQTNRVRSGRCRTRGWPRPACAGFGAIR